MSDEQGLVTIMDVARDHAARQAYCGCVICRSARMVEDLQTQDAESERQAALTERLMREWP